MKPLHGLGWATCVAAMALGCSSMRGPKGFESVQFESAPRPAFAESYPNWPEKPEAGWDLMNTATARLERVKPTAAGTSGAEQVVIFIRSIDSEFMMKVKLVPEDLDGINNSPRRELAAYQVQKLFLDEVDYVTPPNVVRCIPEDVYKSRRPGTDVQPQVPGSDCVLVNATLWLKDLTVPKVVYEKERFLTDPTYARYMADFNLFAYLIEHQDGRSGNFLVSTHLEARQIFAIDNGVSFGAFFYNWFVPNWGTLRVAALRKESVDRLRKLTREDLDAFLVVQQLAADGARGLGTVKSGPARDPGSGVYMEKGLVQFGLKESEVDDMWERIQELLADVDSGKIPLF